jgi:hypothetical protein
MNFKTNLTITSDHLINQLVFKYFSPKYFPVKKLNLYYIYYFLRLITHY